MNFFKKHPDLSLIVITVVFLSALAAFYIWGIGVVTSKMNSAISAGTPSGTGSNADFKLDQAEALNLKGLVQ